MAHQVLARKYRPQRFADVAGQEHVTVTLMNALTQGRIAHGYIFSGHRGIGKTTIARILAMALNCRNAIGTELRPSAEPCEQCESCTEIRAGSAVDVIEIDAATNRGIDEIRELRDGARYRPARDRYKIYILDEAHQITEAAFNALLKTLEEPPEHIIFMMATTQPEDIPQTVRSRCQHFSFHAVKMVDILIELRSIAEREDIAADDSALSLLAEAGDGSMRDALSIMDQAIASAPIEGGRPRLDVAQIRELMGTVSNAAFERMLDAVDEGGGAEVITLANELLDAGNSPSQLSRQCVRYLRNCLMAKISGLTADAVMADGVMGELLQTSPDEQRRAARTSAKFSEEELTRFLQVMLRTFDELGYRQEQRFHFELGLLKLVHLRRLLPMEEVLSRLPGGSSASGKIFSTPKETRPEKAIFASAKPLGAKPVTVQVTSETSSTEAKTLPSLLERDTQRRGQATISLAPPSAGTHRTGGPSQEGRLSTQPTLNSPVLAQIDNAQADSVSTPIIDDTDSLSDSVVDAKVSSNMAVDKLKEMGVAALSRARSQGSAADAIEDAEWALENGLVRIQTALTPTMLPMVLNPEAEKILRGALREVGGGGLRVELLPGKARAEDGTKRVRRPASGTAQAKAEQHPIVQQAQKLFHAEIRKVIDLTEEK